MRSPSAGVAVSHGVCAGERVGRGDAPGPRVEGFDAAVGVGVAARDRAVEGEARGPRCPPRAPVAGDGAPVDAGHRGTPDGRREGVGDDEPDGARHERPDHGRPGAGRNPSSPADGRRPRAQVDGAAVARGAGRRRSTRWPTSACRRVDHALEVLLDPASGVVAGVGARDRRPAQALRVDALLDDRVGVVGVSGPAASRRRRCRRGPGGRGRRSRRAAGRCRSRRQPASRRVPSPSGYPSSSVPGDEKDREPDELAPGPMARFPSTGCVPIDVLPTGPPPRTAGGCALDCPARRWVRRGCYVMHDDAPRGSLRGPGGVAGRGGPGAFARPAARARRSAVRRCRARKGSPPVKDSRSEASCPGVTLRIRPRPSTLRNSAAGATRASAVGGGAC